MNSLHPLALKVVASTLLLAVLPLRTAAAEQISACQPTLQQTRTAFPQRSQQLGEHGVVQVLVRLGIDGRAAAVSVAQSSGYPALDRAATDSVSKYWRFDVTNCTAVELQNQYDVAVHFERTARYTLSNTIDWNSIAAAKKLVNSDRCEVADDTAGTQVFSCIPDGAAARERNAKLVERTVTR